MNRKILVLLAIFCFVIGINGTPSLPTEERHSSDFKSAESFENTITVTQEENSVSAPDRILVKYKEQANRRVQNVMRASIEASYGIRKIRYFSFIDVYLYEVTWYKEMTVRGLNRDRNVEYAEEDFLVSIDSTLPNDPSFSNLWGLHNTGQTGGTADADIDAPEAWDLSTGSSSAVVAVIDTGVDYNHQDLSANMWINSGETPGNGVDDDGNGYVDDYYGMNAINGSGDPMDDHSHGTHCSGTIAAVGNNGTGVVGVCWTAQIMALKFLNSSGSGWTSDAIECIEYAIDKGTHFMSNSWGSIWYSFSLKNAIEAAKSAGIIFVAAAGNSGTNNDTLPHYPSSYDLDNIIAVTATDSSDSHWYNYGLNSVDVAAPGRSIYSTLPNDSYGSYNGTSMAAPHVSGLAALLKAYDSGLSWQEIKNRILDNVEQKNSLAGKILTGGRINAYNSLNAGIVSPVISGTVYNLNSQGIEDVTITFSNSGGTATTDSSGDYSQTVSSGWSGTATPSMSDYTFSPSSRDYTNVTSSLSGQNYEATATATNYTISGNVYNSSGQGISDVTLTFSDGGETATTDSNGDYSQTVSSGWSGTVTPSKTGYTFSPTSKSYSNVTSSLVGQNYTATATGSSEVMNGGMEDGTTSPDYWGTYNNELTEETGWIQGVAHGGSRSIKIINSTGTTAGWRGEDVNFSNAYPTTLTFNAWAKAEDVTSGGIFALDFYIEFEDGSSTWYYDDLRFSHGTHDWEKAESAKTFDKGVRMVRPYCLLYSTTGTVWFDDVSVSEGGGGDDPGLLNPGMEDGNRVPDYWWTYDNDFSRQKGWKIGVAHGGRRSLQIKNSKGKDSYWEGEKVSYSSPYPTSLTLGGWARATKVKGQGTFAIRFYIEFEDGTSTWYDEGLRFNHGTHGWQNVERTATFSQGITSIRPYCILFSTRGYAWFDDVYANRD